MVIPPTTPWRDCHSALREGAMQGVLKHTMAAVDSLIVIPSVFARDLGLPDIVRSPKIPRGVPLGMTWCGKTRTI